MENYLKSNIKLADPYSNNFIILPAFRRTKTIVFEDGNHNYRGEVILNDTLFTYGPEIRLLVHGYVPCLQHFLNWDRSLKTGDET